MTLGTIIVVFNLVSLFTIARAARFLKSIDLSPKLDELLLGFLIWLFVNMGIWILYISLNKG